jgi:hypothetical protein
MRGRNLRRVLVIAAAALAFSSFAISPSFSACVGPSIAFEGASNRTTMRVAPGDEVTLIGEFWTGDCFDTGPNGACERGPGDELPMTGIDVDLLRGENVVVRVVEDASADDDLKLRVTFLVPEIAGGAYRIVVHDRGAEGDRELFLRIRT